MTTKIMGLNLLLGFLLTGSTVVADDVSNLATGNKTTADARRVSPVHLHASATDATSATTLNLDRAAQMPPDNGAETGVAGAVETGDGVAGR